MSSYTRLALLALVLCAVLVAGARRAAAATSGAKAQTHSTLLGERAVKFARRLLGVPYRYGGTSPRSGFDCSGFVRFVYEHFGRTLPHSSYAQFGFGRRVSRGALRPGDLVFFDGVGHVGMYIGGGRFIHAPHTGTRVSIAPLAGWYSARYDGARRLV
jgi:cell wall-associated NlpC family hydrolase